jgi:hypothetical protein
MTLGQRAPAVNAQLKAHGCLQFTVQLDTYSLPNKLLLAALLLRNTY